MLQYFCRTGARLRTVANNRYPDARTGSAGGSSICDQPIRCVLESRNHKSNYYDLLTKCVQLCQARHAKVDTSAYRCSESPVRPFPNTAALRLPRLPTMTDKSKKRNRAILSLDFAISLVDIGKEVSSATPVPAVFGVATILLNTIRVSFMPLPEREVPGSNVFRTKWQTNRIAWTLGYYAPMYVMRLSGEQAEGGQTNSASWCAMR